MKSTVKSLVLFTCVGLFSISGQAQLKLPGNSALASDLKKVIADYPSHFDHIRGELIAEHPQSTEYKCNFSVNGAEESSITRYSSKKIIYSWEAVLLTTENFEKARQKFKSVFNQLNNLVADIGDTKNVKFRGHYESPAESQKFTSVVFQAEPVTETSRKVKMEISLQFHAPMEWKLKVLVYDQEREDEERGSRVD